MVATRNITDLNTLVTPQADDIMLIVDRLSSTSTEAKQITWASVIEAVQDIVAQLSSDSPTVAFTYDDTNGTLTAAVVNNASTQKTIFTDGVTTSTRQEAKFLDGPGVNVVVTDDNTYDCSKITVNNTGVVNASNTTVSGASFGILSSVDVEADGSKSLALSRLKVGSTKLTATSTDSGQSITFDVDPSVIDINDLDTSNPLGVSVGGTGASTASAARTNLAAAKSGNNSDISELSGLTTALSVTQGGTGDTTASAALKNLQGLNSCAHVGASGQSLVYQASVLNSGSYRAEFRGIKSTSDNYINVTTDGSDIALTANPNNILDGVSGVRDISSARITNASAPVGANDLATKAYVDSQTNGLDIKASVIAASTGNIAGTYNSTAKTITKGSNGAISIDGQSLSLNARVLLKDQSSASRNGIYTVTTVGNGSTPYVLTRASDFDVTSEIGAGSFAYVETGTANAGKSFVQSVQDPVLDSDDLSFSIFSQTSIGANSITNANLEQVPQSTVKGRAAGAGTGNLSDLTADELIAVINTGSTATINAARVVSGGLSADSVDNTKLSNMDAATIKGRATTTGRGDPVDLTAAQLIAIINTESSATINSARVTSPSGNSLATSLSAATSALDCGTY
jgi:hypothetical protein